MTADQSAGFSVVEMLVVAAILAGVAVILAGSLHPPLPNQPSGPESFRRFLLEARSVVVLSGTPGVVTLEAGHAHFLGKTVEWTGELRLGSRPAPAGYKLVVNPDGTFSGAHLSLDQSGSTSPAPGVYRSEPAR